MTGFIEAVATDVYLAVSWSVTNEPPKQLAELKRLYREAASRHEAGFNEQQVGEIVALCVEDHKYYSTPIKKGTYSVDEEAAKLGRANAIVIAIGNDNNCFPMPWKLYKSAFPLFGRGDYQDYLDRFLTELEEELRGIS